MISAKINETDAGDDVEDVIFDDVGPSDDEIDDVSDLNLEK